MPAIISVDKQFARVSDQRVHYVQRRRSGYNWMVSLPRDTSVKDPVVTDDDLQDESQWAELDPADYLPTDLPA